MSSIIITGANGNLGQTVTSHLLDNGHHILAVGMASDKSLPPHKNLEFHPVDLLDKEQTDQFIKAVILKNSDLTAAILLAGGFAMGSLEETDEESLDKMIRLNFLTAFNIAKPLLTYFKSRSDGGRFILIGSRPGQKSEQGKAMFAYALSKAMIFKLAEFINAEGKDKNISATVIVPSTIDTPANRAAMPDTDFSKWVPAENIAEAISFSLSETGKMIHNQIINIYNKS